MFQEHKQNCEITVSRTVPNLPNNTPCVYKLILISLQIFSIESEDDFTYLPFMSNSTEQNERNQANKKKKTHKGSGNISK